MINLRMIVEINQNVDSSGVFANNPEFENRLNDAAYKFQLEVSKIISDTLKIDSKVINRDALCSDSEKALITVKFNLEKYRLLEDLK